MNKIIFLIGFVLSISIHAQNANSQIEVGNTADQTTNKVSLVDKVNAFWEDYSKEIKTVFFGFIISTFASWFTVKLSMKKFRVENWWQLKTQTYSKIIESLHHMKTYFSENFNDQIEIIWLSDDKKKDLDIRWRSSYDALLMEVDKDSFIISKRSAQILDDCFKKLNKISVYTSGFAEYFNDGAGIIIECLEQIRAEAKRDLKVK